MSYRTSLPSCTPCFRERICVRSDIRHWSKGTPVGRRGRNATALVQENNKARGLGCRYREMRGACRSSGRHGLPALLGVDATRSNEHDCVLHRVPTCPGCIGNPIKQEKGDPMKSNASIERAVSLTLASCVLALSLSIGTAHAQESVSASDAENGDLWFVELVG